MAELTNTTIFGGLNVQNSASAAIFYGNLVGSASIGIPTTSASYALTASYAPFIQINQTSCSWASASISASYVPTDYVEKGIISGSSFAGLPYSSSVVFNCNMPSIMYVINIIGEDLRGWSVGDRSISGFTINSNSNRPLAGFVFWRAEEI